MDYKNIDTKSVVSGLLARAKNDPSFTLKMIADLDGVIDELKLKVNPEDESYKELALKIYHFKNTTLNSFIDDMPNVDLDRGKLQDVFGSVDRFYF